jgi:hypothetical protein
MVPCSKVRGNAGSPEKLERTDKQHIGGSTEYFDCLLLDRLLA